MSRDVIFVGLDVHKESITAVVLPGTGGTPLREERLPNDPPHIRRFIAPLARQYEVRACYEASSVGFVLQRQLEQLDVACAVIAPSLTPPSARREAQDRSTRRAGIGAATSIGRVGADPDSHRT